MKHQTILHTLRMQILRNIIIEIDMSAESFSRSCILLQEEQVHSLMRRYYRTVRKTVLTKFNWLLLKAWRVASVSQTLTPVWTTECCLHEKRLLDILLSSGWNIEVSICWQLLHFRNHSNQVTFFPSKNSCAKSVLDNEGWITIYSEEIMSYVLTADQEKAQITQPPCGIRRAWEIRTSMFSKTPMSIIVRTYL